MKTLLCVLGSVAGAGAAAGGVHCDHQRASPVPSTEPILTGWIDLGYVWNTGVGGSYDTYRSIIDVHSGPKLLGTDFTLADPKHRWFDTIQVRATTWGAEPSSSVHVEAKKSGLYDFNADYRDFAYYQFPAFLRRSPAQPRHRFGRTIFRYPAQDRRAVSRHPAWPLVDALFRMGSRFQLRNRRLGLCHRRKPVPGSQHPARFHRLCIAAGVRIEKPHFHLTLEEGGTAFKSDQSLYQNPGSTNFGNFSASPIFGQTLDLTSLLAAYGIGGSSAYSKALLTASPTAGSISTASSSSASPTPTSTISRPTRAIFICKARSCFIRANRSWPPRLPSSRTPPRSLGAEIRPLKRVRIVESWMTDRLHDAGSAASTDTLLVAGSSLALIRCWLPRWSSNYSQESLDVFFDASSKLTLRGGYRYVWGDAATLSCLPPDLRVPIRSSSGKTSEWARPLTGPARRSRSLAKSRAHRRAGFTSAPACTTIRRCARKFTISRSQSLSVSADFTLLNNQQSAGRDQLRLLFAPGVAVVLLGAEGQQDFRHPGHLFALRSEVQHRISGA